MRYLKFNRKNIPITIYPRIFGGLISGHIIDHIKTHNADDITLEIKCIQDAVKKITSINYNSYIIQKDKDVINSLRNTCIVSFGRYNTLYIKNKLTYEIIEIPLYDGSFVVIDDKFDDNLEYTIKISKGYILQFTTNGENQNSIKNRIIEAQDVRNIMNVGSKSGNFCINGSNLDKKLLKYLDLEKMIGTGSFGNVFIATTKDKKHKFAVKLAKIPKNQFVKSLTNTSQAWHETIILKDIIKPLIEKGICPNLPLLIDNYSCDDCEFLFKVKNKMTSNKSTCLIFLMELASGDMESWFKTKPSDDEMYCALFQIMAGIHTLQKYAQMSNNDIKVPNILYYDVEPGGYWNYNILGKNFYVPNYGKLFIVNDFGVSRTYSPDFILSNPTCYHLGSRHMVIGNKISHLTPTKNFLTCKETEPYLWNWYTNPDKNSQNFFVKLNNGQSSMKIPSKKILSFTPKFTPEQLEELKIHKISPNTELEDFYRHPEIIVPMEFQDDTQDAIKIFTGGSRSSQEGIHRQNGSNTVFNKLANYVIPYKNMYSFETKCVLAGHFILDFFTKVVPYTIHPSEKIIATYTI